MSLLDKCANCKCEVSASSAFCRHCGKVQIRNPLIHEKSTASYDPGSIDLKPWRETGKLATNHWRKREAAVPVSQKEPWRPPMKQNKVFLTTAGGKPPSIPWPEDPNRSKLVTVISPSLNKTVSLSNGKTIKYKGRLWAKPGEKKRNRKTLFSEDRLFSNIPHLHRSFQSVYEDEGKEELPEMIFPLGVYSAEWLDLPSPHRASCAYTTITSIHIALYESSTESLSGKSVLSRWLRIGYVVDGLDEDGGDAGTGTEGGGDLVIVAFLPNEVAKCMGVSEEDWVDLQYVSALLLCIVRSFRQ